MTLSAKPILTVTQLSAQIKEHLEGRFPSVWVCGEVLDFSQSAAGHIYFTLKDDNAQIRCVIWRTTASRLRFRVQDGMQLVCQGEMNVYGPRGTYQLSLKQLEPRGEGAHLLARRQLHARLSAEGLFDPARKRPLPSFPRRIALITSPTGAAVRDFLEVTRRRWQGIHVIVCPARVQGEGAAQDIVRQISAANHMQPPPQVIVLARGGGSSDDLGAFDDERVVRAIAASHLPLVSAVGHEIDVTLSDLVADVRALTPTEAAERVLPSAEELATRLTQWQVRLSHGLRRKTREYRVRLQTLVSHRLFRRPFALLEEPALKLDDLQVRAQRAIRGTLQHSRERWQNAAAQLESLSPLGTLVRGYTVTLLDDQCTPVRHPSQVEIGDKIITQLAAGRIISRVEETQSMVPGDSHE